jgi:hypothetical protein
MVSKCAEFRQECRDNFFFRFSTRFDPLLAILLVLGGRAYYIGEPGQKDLEKIRKTTKKSPKMKKIEHGIKMCRISSGMP